MAIPNQSVRIRDLERLETPQDVAAKQEVLVPVASNGEVKESYSIPINTLAAWLLLNYAADKDLSNLTATGQSIIDHKQDYFFDNPTDSDLNTFTEDGIWKVEVTGAVECHTPNSLTGYFIISVDTADENTIEQQARELHTSPGNVYRRQRVNGTWGAWSMITQDMSNPIFINSPTVVNPGTSDNQLSTIGQLNSKFADVFKTQLYITEGLLITGLPSYSGGTLTIPAGSKYITNTSIETVVGTDITGTVPTSGRSFVFVDESQTIKTFTNFQKVMDVPETMESGTLYYIITSDTYQDTNNIYQLAPIGIVDDGVFTQSDSIQLMNIDSLIAALGTLGIEDKVDQMVGDLAQNSQVSSDLEYSRTISAGAYDISNPEEPVMTSGARVSVQNKELSEDGSTLSNNPQFLAAATDGTNTSELIIKPDSARLKVPRLVVPSDIATLFDLDELNTNKADKATDFQTPITSANKGATMAEITALDNDLQAQITSNDADILKNTQDITALKGAGGALTAYNFNTATPTQETLTKYAVDQIWPGNTNWAWNAANPAASTFTSADGVSRTAAEIFNSTWVNNTYDDHRWQLTNTQNTTPKVFEWGDVGRDIVAVATATTAGIVRVGSGSQMVVNPTTGDISLDGTKAESIRGTIGAVATNQGTANAGKVLTVGDDGNIELADGASGASGTGRNIGDIFWTTRTDSALNGAVEANGAQYNFADVNQGQNNVQALLVSGALPSVSIAEFDAKVASDGGCDSFGYGTNELIIYPVTFVFGSTPSILCYTNITNWHEVERDHNKLLNVKLYDKDTHEELVGWYVKYMPETDYYYVYNNSDEAMYGSEAVYPDGDGEPITLPTGGEFQPTTYFKVPKKNSQSEQERPMVQLFNSATDEAVATCTSVLADVAGLKQTTDGMIDYVVESQEPTAENGYTWYRLYKSGWVEQGGWVTVSGAISSSNKRITFPIEMANDRYVAMCPSNANVGVVTFVGWEGTTGMSVGPIGNNGGKTTWYVCGMSAQGAQNV